MSNSSASRTAGIAAWALAVFCLVVGLYVFSVQKLQNNSADFSRQDVWILLPELLSENLAADPTGSSGWKYLPQRFDLLGIAALILVFAWGWGRSIVRRLIPDWADLDQCEAMFWSLSTGLATWGTITLLLGICGCLWRSLFLCVGIIPVLLEWIACRRSKSDSMKAQATGRRWSGLGIACSLAIIPFVLAILLGSLQPPNDFDVKEYHLEGVKEHYLAGQVRFLPHNVYTSFPFLTEMLCLSGMVLRQDWFRGALAGQAVLAAFALITALGIFTAARRWLGQPAAWFAVLIHLTCPWIYRISIIAYAEGGLACFLLAAFVAGCRALDSSDSQSAGRWAALAGLLSGAAVGCKYPGALTVVIPIGLVLASHAYWPRRVVADMATTHGSPLRNLSRIVGLFACGVLITWGPWLIKNVKETGNPVYPLVYSLFGGKDWDAASHAKWQAGHPLPLKQIDGLTWIVRDTRDRLWEVFLGSDWQSGLYIALTGAVAFVFWRRSRDVTAIRFLVLSAVYSLFLFLCWQYLTHRIDRFWVPMLPILSLLAGAGAGELWKFVSEADPDRSWEVHAACRSLIAIPVFSMVIFNLGLATSAQGGNNSYLMEFNTLCDLVKTPTLQLVEPVLLNPHDKVLFVGEAEVFDARFPYEYNTVFDASIFEQDCSAALPGITAAEQPLRPIGDIRTTWKARGITLIVVNWSEILRYRTTYRHTDFVHPRRFAQLVDHGLLSPIAAVSDRAMVPWDKVPSEKQRELEQWAPELKQRQASDAGAFRAVQAYRVIP